jgi:hypothetical protein
LLRIFVDFIPTKIPKKYKLTLIIKKIFYIFEG